MNGKLLNVLALIAMFVVIASVVEAHKNKLYSQPQFDGRQEERCVCDCGPGGPGGPILPNKPYYGNAGYAPRPVSGGGGGYGNQGSYAVSGSYGNGGGRVTGGY